MNQKYMSETLEAFKAACKEQDISVSADGRVNEQDAATLIGYAHGSLKNLRTMGAGPPYYLRAVGGNRVSYRLTELAEWIERGRQEF